MPHYKTNEHKTSIPNALVNILNQLPEIIEDAIYQYERRTKALESLSKDAEEFVHDYAERTEVIKEFQGATFIEDLRYALNNGKSPQL